MTQENIKILTKLKNGEILSESEIAAAFEDAAILEVGAEEDLGFVSCRAQRALSGDRSIGGPQVSEILGQDWSEIFMSQITRINDLRKLAKTDVINMLIDDVSSGAISKIITRICVNQSVQCALIALDPKCFDFNVLFMKAVAIYYACQTPKNAAKNIADIVNLKNAFVFEHQ